MLLTKKFPTLLLLVIITSFTLSSCDNSSRERRPSKTEQSKTGEAGLTPEQISLQTYIAANLGEEVLPGTFDNGRGGLFIKFQSVWGKELQTIAETNQKLDAWHTKYPLKEELGTGEFVTEHHYVYTRERTEEIASYVIGYYTRYKIKESPTPTPPPVTEAAPTTPATK